MSDSEDYIFLQHRIFGKERVNLFLAQRVVKDVIIQQCP
jgi:hypothetical protein